MTRSIRVLPWSAAPADQELASSAALLAGLEAVGQPAMRWYEMAPPALVLGSGQRPADVNMATCLARGVPVVRRSSGGGAVFSGVSLSLDIALPPLDPLDSHDITESYRWLGETWVAALASLGVAARLVSVAEARADAQALSPLLKRVCYAGLSPYEVAVGSRKVVGLAQRRRRQGALLQGGVYLRWPSEETAALVGVTDEEQAALAEALPKKVAGLDELRVGGAPSLAALRAAFEAALRERGVTPSPAEWTAMERVARDAALAQYAPLSTDN
ncbi:MAG: ligase [Anaerolineae bacterium]